MQVLSHITVTKHLYIYVIVPRKRAHNVGTLESLFIVESDKAFFQLQNDTKIDRLAVFYPEICSREW